MTTSPIPSGPHGSSPWARPGGDTQTGGAWLPPGPDAQGPAVWAPPAGGWMPAPVAPTYAPMPAAIAPAYAPMPAPVQPVPAPMPAPVVGAPVRRRTATARLVDGLLVISLVVAAGGVGYAVGRQTAPATPTGGGGNRDFPAFGVPGTGTTPGGTTGRLPTDGGSAQVAAPSGAPVVPEGTTAPATEGGSTTTAVPAVPGGQQPGGGFGPGGFGRGGLSGTVSAVDPTTITVTTQDGSELQVTTTDSTTYHEQLATTPDVITVGAPVRVTVPGTGRPGGFGGGPAASPATDPQATVATEVALLAEASAATAGGRGGRLGGVTGTVAAIDDASITIAMADGQQTQVATDASTSWIQQTVVTRDAITPGVSVRFSVEGGFGGPGQGGPGQGQPPAAGQGDPLAAIAVSNVEVLLPAS